MMTLIPGKSLPDSMRQMLCGAPRSTRVTRSFRRALVSTKTVVGSGLDAPCRHSAIFVRQPKEVLTERADNPKLWNILAKELVRETRGRSSATTTHVRTQLKLIPRCYNKDLGELKTKGTRQQTFNC